MVDAYHEGVDAFVYSLPFKSYFVLLHTTHNNPRHSMKTFAISLKGITPLLLNKFTDAALMSIASGKRKSSAAPSNTPFDEAESKLYTNDAGVPVIPACNLMSCITEGGKFFKQGKSQLTTSRHSIIPALIQFSIIEIPIIHDVTWQVDVRPVVNPATNMRNVRYRPRFDDWKLDVEITLDTDELSEALFRDVVDAAGNKIGLGDFRPSRKGPYGRFKVVKWEAA
jgi:hypothetical protein